MHTKGYTQANSSGLYDLSGLYTLSLRLVVGWTYFSACWRRIILENKLIENVPGYVGEKFNHFLPNAIGIKPLIEYLVTNHEELWWFIVIFTMIEGFVGLLFILGYLTRLMSIGILSLAFGILLGSGWLGTTCLDEWQIGVLGVAAGFTLFLSGGGYYSLDTLLTKKRRGLHNYRWSLWITSGELPLSLTTLKKIVLVGSTVILFLTLFTNQAFHNGVWGPLHNKSVKPKIEISNAQLNSGQLTFTIYRVEGVDVYGAFVIEMLLKDDKGHDILKLDANDLSVFPVNDIHNYYITKILPGKHSLIVPLGGKAELKIVSEALSNISPGEYELILTDVSGLMWKAEILKE